MERLTDIEVPQGGTRTAIDYFEFLRVVSESNKSASGRHHTGEGLRVSNLRIAPGEFPFVEIEGKQILPGVFVRKMFCTRGVVDRKSVV